MNINDLNMALQNKKPSNIVKARLDDNGNTKFYDFSGKFMFILYRTGQFYFHNAIAVDDDFFNIVNPYLKTPIDDRMSNIKYFVILGADSGVYSMYHKVMSHGDVNRFKLANVSKKDLFSKLNIANFEFTAVELSKLYDYLNRNYSERYEHIAEWSAVQTSEVSFEN